MPHMIAYIGLKLALHKPNFDIFFQSHSVTAPVQVGVKGRSQNNQDSTSTKPSNSFPHSQDPSQGGLHSDQPKSNRKITKMITS